MAARPSPASRRRRRLALFGAGALLLAVALAAAWHVTDGLGRRDDPGDAAPLDPDAANAQPRRARLPAADAGAPTPLADAPDDARDPYAVPERLQITARLLAPNGKPAADALLALFDEDGALLATTRADPRGRARLELQRPPQAPFTKRYFPLLAHGRGFAPTLRRRTLQSGDATLEVGEVEFVWISGETDCDHLLDLDDAERARRLWARLSSPRSPQADTAPDRVLLRVLDAQGEPAPHALVRRFSRPDEHLRPYLDAVFVRPPPALHFAWTDAEGVAELPLPDAARHYVVAVARGHRVTGLWLPARRAEPVDVRLESQPVRQFRLTFGGVPVDGSRADVRLWRRAPGKLDRIAASRVLDPVLEYSEERARWLLRAEPDGPLTLSVLHPEHGRRLVALDADTGTRDVPTFELGEGASFELRAMNTRGEPLAHQRFELEQLERPELPPNTGQERVVHADEQGVLRVRALAPGAWHLTPRDPVAEPVSMHDAPRGPAGPTRRLDLRAGEHLVADPFVVESGSELVVRAVVPKGAPEFDDLKPVLRLGAVSAGQPRVSGPHSESPGVWRYENVPAGRHRVFLGPRGRAEVDVPPDGRAECDVRLAGWFEVTGRVTLDGAPVPHALLLQQRLRIGLSADDTSLFGDLEMSTNYKRFEADADGRFRTQVMEGETLWLFATDPSAEFVSEALSVRPTEPSTHLELPLRPRDDDAPTVELESSAWPLSGGTLTPRRR